MKDIPSGKTKNDKIDSYKSACLLRGGNFPKVYAYGGQILVLIIHYGINQVQRLASVQDISYYA